MSSVERGAAPKELFAGRVFLVGNRYGHHARHSGYEGFQRYLGNPLKPPLGFRFLKVKNFPMLGWRIDSAVGWLMRRECYSVALLATEIGAAVHMMSHSGSIYHFLYGDTDVCWLGRLRKLLGTRVVASFHEADEGLEYLKIDQRITRALDAVILVSDAQRPYFEKLLPPERIFVVPHGVDTEFFHPAPQRSDAPLLLTVGGHLRDFETLERAIDRIQAEVPAMRFVAVGAHHGHTGRQFAHPRVEFREGVSDEELRGLYQRARAVMFSFKQATANNSLLEAMACGAPVVATEVGGVREYLGGGGILSPAYDSGAMAEAAMRLLRDPQLAGRLGAAGRSAAMQFDYAQVAERQARVYSEIERL